jgi:hypothetical protein
VHVCVCVQGRSIEKEMEVGGGSAGLAGPAAEQPCPLRANITEVGAVGREWGEGGEQPCPPISRRWARERALVRARLATCHMRRGREEWREGE